MIKKHFTILILILTLPIVSFGQIDKLNEAYRLAKENNLLQAKEVITQATLSPETTNNPRAWYYKGWIFKNLFNDNKKGPQATEYRLTALRALEKSLSIDANTDFATDCKKMGLYLSSTFYNDGIDSYKSQNYKDGISYFTYYIDETEKISGNQLDVGAYFLRGLCHHKIQENTKAKQNLETAYKKGYSDPNLYYLLAKIYEGQYEIEKAIVMVKEGSRKYPENKNIMITSINLFLSAGKIEEAQNVLEQAVSTQPSNIEWLLTLGNVYEKKALREPEQKQIFLAKAKQAYKKVLSLEPNNFMANFNLGILLYNNAVNLVNNQEYDIDIFALDNVLDESTELFKEALPYVEKANAMKPADKGTLVALEAIYINLRYEDKVDQIQEQMKKMGYKEEAEEENEKRRKKKD